MKSARCSASHLNDSPIARALLRNIGGTILLVLNCLAIVVALSQIAAAEVPVHKQIDELVVAKAKGASFAPVAGDAEFARRIYLDLIGRIPSYQELKTFLDDKAADKRVKLVDALLQNADYPRRMQELFSNMLLERRGDNPEWAKFLRSSFETNKPWDQLAREIVDPDPDNESTRAAAFFVTKRLEKVGEQETDYPGLTRDVGRLFLGMDLQCAQCHNHLFIDNYKQQDFQGLFIAFQNTFIRSDLKFPAVGEKPITQKLEFMSVFDKVPLATGPRMPGGKELEIPKFEKGQEFAVPPNKQKNFPGTPKFSALEVLAHEMSTPQNRAFVDNITNRLWWVMMGRGLVNPLDQQHQGNPPSHPEVMELLAREFVANKFDVKWMLRELALTETYQRSSIVAAEGERPAPETYRVAGEKRLAAEQVYWSVLAATGTREWTGPPKLGETVKVAEAPKSEDGSDEEKKDSNAKPKKEPFNLEKFRLALVKAFANPPQDPETEFSPSLKAALFVLNDKMMLELISAREGNLLDRLIKQADPAALADEMYGAILSRTPSDEEKKWVTEYVAANANRREAAINNIAWALLASTEFCVNH